jgi:hypothetical protein
VRAGEGSDHNQGKVLVAMGIVVCLTVFALLVIASFFGWVADSRDHREWSPTHGGRRVP